MKKTFAEHLLDWLDPLRNERGLIQLNGPNVSVDLHMALARQAERKVSEFTPRYSHIGVDWSTSSDSSYNGVYWISKDGLVHIPARTARGTEGLQAWIELNRRRTCRTRSLESDPVPVV